MKTKRIWVAMLTALITLMITSVAAQADWEVALTQAPTNTSVKCKAWKGGDILAADVDKSLDEGGGVFLTGSAGNVSFELTVSPNPDKGAPHAILTVTDQVSGMGSRNRGVILKDEPFEVMILKNGGGIGGEADLSKFLVSCVIK